MFHAIIQVRMGSSRLPGKALRSYMELSPLKILYKRLKKSQKISKIIIATTTLKKDLKIIKFCKKFKVPYFRGSPEDVLSRYYFTAKKFKSKNIIRLTADNPFVDIKTLNKLVNLKIKGKYNYVSNAYPLPTNYPDGSEIEIFDFRTLEKTFFLAMLPSEREHVTFFMVKSKFFKKNKLKLKNNLSKFRYTIDVAGDFKVFSSLIDAYPGKRIFTVSMNEIVNYLKKNKKITKYQKKIKRNFGWKSSFKKDKIFKKLNKYI